MNSFRSVPPNPNPGWYQLTGEPDIERYWDGVQWTEHVRVKKQWVRWTAFSPFLNTKLWKWYGLAVAVLAVTIFLASSFVIQRTNSKDPLSTNLSINEVCGQILNFDWYKLNTREFMNDGDASARQSNALFLSTFMNNDKDLNALDRRFFEIFSELYVHVDAVAQAQIWFDAAEAGTKADTAFVALSEHCSQYLPNVTVPVLSESTENNSSIDETAQQRIPETYTDTGEGLAYTSSGANSCGPEQYGCTRLEIYAYKDCPKGVMVYANLFDANGMEVARTDGRTDRLVAGQSDVLMLSTGLGTASSATVSKLVCE